MYLNLDWQITVGNYQLALLEKCEVHSSVDLLADTCTITLPEAVYNKAFRVEETLLRGDKVQVRAGYGGQLVTEFTGYLLRVDTNNNVLTIECEDALFLMRLAVADKQFKTATVKEIAQYLIAQTGGTVTLNCTLDLGYTKFVIRQATAYDVLNKLQQETAGNIYMKETATGWELNIHPPYSEAHGNVKYTFQQNIEKSDLKYIRRQDRKLEVVIERIDKTGKVVKEQYGTTGGDQVTLKRGTMDAGSAAQTAKNEYLRRMTDGYEGSITCWLVPFCAPGYTAEILDADYEYKDGSYYVTAVTTSISNQGGIRAVQLGIKTGVQNG